MGQGGGAESKGKTSVNRKSDREHEKKMEKVAHEKSLGNAIE